MISGLCNVFGSEVVNCCGYVMAFQKFRCCCLVVGMFGRLVPDYILGRRKAFKKVVFF